MPDSDSCSPEVVVFLDLDNNIFQSLRRRPLQQAEPVAYTAGGLACSFMSGTQRAFFNWLNSTTLVIPNTARDTNTFARVDLPFRSYSICSFGGVILRPDSKVETAWYETIEPQARQAQSLLDGVHALVRESAQKHNFDIRVRLLNDSGLDLYINIRHNQHHPAELLELAEEIKPQLPPNWTVHHNDNNLAFFPDFLGKEKAARWLLKEIIKPRQNAVIIGSGDSFTDMPMMAMADFALMPCGSQAFAAAHKHAANHF